MKRLVVVIAVTTVVTLAIACGSGSDEGAVASAADGRRFVVPNPVGLPGDSLARTGGNSNRFCDSN